jgi:hypothetical protein
MSSTLVVASCCRLFKDALSTAKVIWCTENCEKGLAGNIYPYCSARPLIHMEGQRRAMEAVSVLNCISHDSQYLLNVIASIAILANLFITN